MRGRWSVRALDVWEVLSKREIALNMWKYDGGRCVGA